MKVVKLIYNEIKKNKNFIYNFENIAEWLCTENTIYEIKSQEELIYITNTILTLSNIEFLIHSNS